MGSGEELGRIPQLVPLAFAVVMLAACGGGEDAPTTAATDGTATSAATDAASAADLDLIGSELGDGDKYGFAFAGENVATPGPIITVPVGEEVTIRFENASDEQNHDFVVAKDKFGTFFEFKPLWGAETKPLGPGESATIAFTPDEAGTYAYVCTIQGHAGNGMHGEFVVEDA